MRHIYNYIAILSLIVFSSFSNAQYPAQSDEETDDISYDEDFDKEIRESIIEIPGISDDIDIPIPDFIKQDANHIIFNGADWTKLRRAFENSVTTPVSIVHIGDSHVQADFSTGTTRELLQYDFGNAGRGLIAPLKMCGTNQPVDYNFQSRSNWKSEKLLDRTWPLTMGFTGCTISPTSSSSEITIATTGSDDYNPFSSITLFHNGRLSVKSVTDDAGRPMKFRSIPSRDYTQIILPSLTTAANISFSSAGDLTLYGVSLSGDRPGLFYHAIGNNGATYNSYNRIGAVGLGINSLKPNLVIISLGTNEAFARSVNTSTLKNSIDRLVGNIRYANPDAVILLTTPMECHRSVTTSKKTRVKLKTKKGRKARYKTVVKTSRSYAVNPNIGPVRNAILDYGKENGIAVYDWYDVAGGRGASDLWIKANLFAKDRVHHTKQGYNVEGRLLYEALLNSMRK